MMWGKFLAGNEDLMLCIAPLTSYKLLLVFKITPQPLLLLEDYILVLPFINISPLLDLLLLSFFALYFLSFIFCNYDANLCALAALQHKSNINSEGDVAVMDVS
jgi:hypothetical protein